LFLFFLPGEPAQHLPRNGITHPHNISELSGRQVIPAGGGQALDVATRISMTKFLFHSHKAANFATLSKWIWIAMAVTTMAVT